MGSRKYEIGPALALQPHAKQKRARSLCSDHPELHPARFADHILIPGRIPDELDIGFIHAVNRQNFALGVVGYCGPHAAARRSERHFHFHAHPAVILFSQTTIVNQTKVNNVDRDFGIVALPKLVPDVFVRNLAVCSADRLLSWFQLAFFKTQGIEIFFFNSRQALVRRNRVATTEALRDYALGSSRDRCLLPAWNLDCLAIAAQREFSVLVHGLTSFSYYATNEANDEWLRGLRHVEPLNRKIDVTV